MDLNDFQFSFEAYWPPLLSANTLLDNFAVPPAAVQTSLSNGPLAITDARETGQSSPTTGPIPFHPSHISSFDNSNSSTDFAIRLLKPLPIPTQGGAVILPRIETHVFLDFELSSGSWNALQLPLTKSVTSDDSSNIGSHIKPLLLEIIVRGATTRQECNSLCEQCEKRTGNSRGAPSLIDYHSPSNVIIPRGGTIQVHFTFSCYSRHHRKQDKEYVLEVILKDASNPFEPIEVARKELPYSFDVRSTTPRHQANTISSPSNIRGRAEHPGPVAIIHSEGSSSRINALCISPGSDAGVQSVSDRNTYKGQSCAPSDLFAHAPKTAFEDAGAQRRRKVAEREIKIITLEGFIKQLRDTVEADAREKDALIGYLYAQALAIQKEIADRLDAFEAERKKAEAARSAEVAAIEAQILLLKQENLHDVSVLTAVANTCSWTGYDDWSGADSPTRS